MSSSQLAYRAYTVAKREGKDDIWLPIGAAFPHQSGEGYTVVLRALPLPNRDGECKIILRLPKDGEERPQKQPVNNKADPRSG